MSMGYAELYCQSNFSFLTGASHPEELVLQASFYGYEAIAITDECSVAGVVRAHAAIERQNLPVKLIVGSVFHLDPDLSLILLCPNRLAYAELCRVISHARCRTKKGSYEVSEWELARLKFCFVLWLPQGDECDNEWAKWMVKRHPSRAWIAFQRPLNGTDHRYRRHCIHLSSRYSLPICAVGAVLMHDPKRLPLQQLITAIRLGVRVDQAGANLQVNAERALRPFSKLKPLFKPEWRQETLEIARRCEFSLSQLRYEYPAELIPQGKTPHQYLRECVAEGVKVRFPEGLSKDLHSTLERELALIEDQQYEFFFLTIYDITRFAKRQGILYQGRGSAANSIVCYCLEITPVDPRKISLLFERFINKERSEPPDIDVDFEHERREEIIQYIYQKYGRKRAALAASVRTYRLKSAIREVGKALGIAESQLAFYLKNINRRSSSLDWREQVVELGVDKESKLGLQFMSLVDQLRGFPRHLSQHVGGFVISSGPLYELVPVENASMEARTVIQWDKDDLESLKLLKIDILALGMLTAIRKSFDLIRAHYQQDVNIAQLTRTMDDPAVYRMIQKADTIGVFQIESRAQMSMLPRLKPQNYYDLVVQIAIVRPGPIQGDMVHPYLKRRDGLEPIEYPSEEVRAVLERTLGVPIFQEQVIKLAMVAAGFSGGEADQLRRAMASWKKTGELDQFRGKLISGMLQRGYPKAYAERIYQQICGFGEYGFPESHSASFAVLAYTSAWLKAHYPAAFCASLLNSLPMGFYSASQLVQDIRRHGVDVLPVCVNCSQYDHSLEACPQGMALRLGLRRVKGLSAEGAHRLLAMRQPEGFSELADIVAVGLKTSDLTALASADALNVLAGNRYQSRWQLMDRNVQLPLLKQADKSVNKPQKKPEQTSFVYTPSALDTLVEDYASLGLTLNQHPITLLDTAGMLAKFSRMSELRDKPHKSLVSVVGLVSGRQSPSTASGVTFVTLEDDTGNINVVVWSGTAMAQKRAFLSAKILRVIGILEREGDVIHVIAGRLIDDSHKLSALDTRSRDFH